MITLKKLQNGNLKMIVDDKESFIQKMILDDKISVIRDSNDEIISVSGYIYLSDLLEVSRLNTSCNWMVISVPLSIHGTDALSDDVQIDDDGNVTFGRYWFDPDAEIRCYWGVLLRDGECEFQFQKLFSKYKMKSL